VSVPRLLRTFVDEPRRAALFLDFDGSLAPIVDDPAAARALPAAGTALARLAPRLGRVGIVSGRPVAFLREQLAIDGLVYAGAYGLERLVDGEVVVERSALPFVDAIARAADEAEVALPGLRVERKGLVAVTIHWREQPERGGAASAWADAAAARLGLDAPLRGRMAVELRPPVAIDKGTTVVELASGASAVAVAGDDAGDLPAFAAVHALAERGDVQHGIAIGVTSSESPPEVAQTDVVVDGPAGLATLLSDLADALSARG
jgi:trehalose 6-phosphate phosphatase